VLTPDDQQPNTADPKYVLSSDCTGKIDASATCRLLVCLGGEQKVRYRSSPPSRYKNYPGFEQDFGGFNSEFKTLVMKLLTE
jgi:hypothetical protein